MNCKTRNTEKEGFNSSEKYKVPFSRDQRIQKQERFGNTQHNWQPSSSQALFVSVFTATQRAADENEIGWASAILHSSPDFSLSQHMTLSISSDQGCRIISRRDVVNLCEVETTHSQGLPVFNFSGYAQQLNWSTAIQIGDFQSKRAKRARWQWRENVGKRSAEMINYEVQDGQGGGEKSVGSYSQYLRFRIR